MISCRIYRLWLLTLIITSPYSLLAQSLSIDVYRIRVITQNGERLRGTLEDVGDRYLWVDSDGVGILDQVPLATVRKVVVRRNSRKRARITGAVLGGLLTSYASVRSLDKNPARGAISYGATVLFSASIGALVGGLTGSAIGNLRSRVIRPLDNRQPEISLFRQLEPLTIEYQQNLMNRLPLTNH